MAAENSGKDLFASKTTWGFVLTSLAPILGMMGINLHPEIVTALSQIIGPVLFLIGQLNRSDVKSVGGFNVGGK